MIVLLDFFKLCQGFFIPALKAPENSSFHYVFKVTTLDSSVKWSSMPKDAQLTDGAAILEMAQTFCLSHWAVPSPTGGYPEASEDS